MLDRLPAHTFLHGLGHIRPLATTIKIANDLLRQAMPELKSRNQAPERMETALRPTPPVV
jgi:hypothetical protein